MRNVLVKKLVLMLAASTSMFCFVLFFCIFCTKSTLVCDLWGQRGGSSSATRRGLQAKYSEQQCLPLPVLKQQKEKTDMPLKCHQCKTSAYGSPHIHMLFRPDNVCSCNWRSSHGIQLSRIPVHIHRCRWVGDAVNSPVDEWPPCLCTATLLLMPPRLLPSAARFVCVACVSCVQNDGVQWGIALSNKEKTLTLWETYLTENWHHSRNCQSEHVEAVKEDIS